MVDDGPGAAQAYYVELTQRVAAHLRRLRAERRWSQEEAARRCTVPLRVYQRIEADAPWNATLHTLARLARGFGVEAADLVSATARRTGSVRPSSSRS